MKSALLSILLGAAFAVSAHATTWTWDYAGTGDPENMGTVATGEGQFQYSGSLADVTLFDLTSFNVGLDFNFDNCAAAGCANDPDYHENLTLANVQTFWFQPSNPQSLEFTTLDSNGNEFYTMSYSDNAAVLNGYIWGSIGNVVDPPDAPEGATVWMLAIGLIFICWLTMRANRASI